MPTDDQRVLKLERALRVTQLLVVVVAAAGAIAIWWVHSLPASELRSGKVVIADDRITIADVRVDADGLAIADTVGNVELNSAGLRLKSSGETKAEMLIVPNRIHLESPKGAVDLAADALRMGTVTESFEVSLLPSRAAVLNLKSGAGASSGSGIELDAGVHPIASGSCFTKECDTVWSLGRPDGDHINIAPAAR